MECEGPLLTGHIHPSLFGSQGLNDHVLLALAIQSPMMDPKVLFVFNKPIIFDIEDPKDEPYQSLSYLITYLAISNWEVHMIYKNAFLPIVESFLLDSKWMLFNMK